MKDNPSAPGKHYYLNHDGVKLKVVLPEMLAPFGAGSSKKFPDKYNMSLSLTRQAQDKLRAIDDKLLDLILAMKADVFAKDAKDKKKNVSIDVLKSRYKSFIVPGDETKGYSDRINLVIQTRSGKALDELPEEDKARAKQQFVALSNNTLLYAPDGTTIQTTTENIRDAIPFGSRVRAVAEFAYLWVPSSSQECYPIWTFVQGILMSSAPKSTFNLLNVYDDEDLLEKKEQPRVEATASELPTYIDERPSMELHVDPEDAHLAAAAL